jgi:hypothetical protein
MTNYTYDQLRDAVQDCTSYDLIQVFDDDHDEYILVDAFGDQDGDPFTELDDVLDFITNNKQVEEYLDELHIRPNGYSYIHT